MKCSKCNLTIDVDGGMACGAPHDFCSCEAATEPTIQVPLRVAREIVWAGTELQWCAYCEKMIPCDNDCPMGELRRLVEEQNGRGQ